MFVVSRPKTCIVVAASSFTNEKIAIFDEQRGGFMFAHAAMIAVETPPQLLAPIARLARQAQNFVRLRARASSCIVAVGVCDTPRRGGGERHDAWRRLLLLLMLRFGRRRLLPKATASALKISNCTPINLNKKNGTHISRRSSARCAGHRTARRARAQRPGAQMQSYAK